MKKVLCAGVFALAAIGLLSNNSQARPMEVAGGYGAQTSASINIARIKSVLKLTPAQEHYWVPVEAALRDLARKQMQVESAGLVRRISNRVVTVVLNSAAVQRLAVAARPLIGMLDAEQMRAAQGLAQEMGLGPVVAALR
ncbi:MAG TPA: hypothetical protein VKE53_00720 [Pseudolabrys sp.]|nr:hypothetical protein [Pseudolabrys sp.]